MAEKKQKLWGWRRRSYLNDFQPDAAGNYVYTGKTHPYEGPVPRKKALAILWALSGGGLAAGIAAGCLPAAGTNNCIYVIIPFTAAFLAAISVIWLQCRLTAGGEALRDYVYKATVAQFKVRGWLTAAFSAAGVVGEIIFLILHGTLRRTGSSVGYLLCLAAQCGLSIAWTLFFGRLRWAK